MAARSTSPRRVWGRIAATVVGLSLAGSMLSVPPVAAVAVTVPAADVLDVTFTSAGAVEDSHSATATVIGAPTYANDATLKRPAATFDGASGVRYAMDDAWSSTNPNNILNTASIECVFRYDGPVPATSTNALCSGRQTGGYSIDVNGSNIRFVVGGTVVVSVPVTAGQWYYAVGTYAGTTGTLYLNGALAGQGTKSTTNVVPAALFWVVGADTKAAGALETFSTGAVAVSRIWSSKLSVDQVSALYAQETAAASVPKPDVLDVDFASGAATDGAQARPASVVGVPVYSSDPALGHTVASFNGASGLRYPFTDPWDTGSATNISAAVTIECVFRFDGVLPVATNNAACSGRQGGGYTIDISGSEIRFVIGGTVAVKVPAKAGLWYHAAATYDGTTAKLYLGGTLAGQSTQTGIVAPPAARYWVIGGDINSSGNLEFYGKATVASARIWSSALDSDQIKELSIAALGDQDSGVSLVSTVPSEGGSLSKPTIFRVQIDNQGAATGWSYLLDGTSIQPGQTIGAGMRAGAHVIVISATDLFGKAIDYDVHFTSGAIPVGGGTETGQGSGRVTLSAAATDPDGGRVTTTFEKSTASAADGGFQGIVPVVPSTLDFAYTGGQELDGKQTDDGTSADSAASHDQVPFQRFDVQVPASGDDRRVQWSGVVDPERTVTVRAWDSTATTWVTLATSRGKSGGDTVLVGAATEAMVDHSTAKPLVHVLVTAEDPFADDLAPRDASAGTAASKDHFENPDDYNFSFVHWSDPQYVVEGATGSTGQYPASADYPTSSGVMTPQEQAVWASAYTDSVDWITSNADARKIAFVAGTGDNANNNYYDPAAVDGAGNLLYPGLDAQVNREFSFVSNSYEPLKTSGIPNQLVAGNHDNHVGTETGPDSRYSKAFPASEWYSDQAGWPAGAEYHAWDETTDASGNVTSQGTDSQNGYVLFSAGGLDFVSVSLAYGVTQQEADWANSVFERYSTRNGILMTHGYMGYSTNQDGRDAPLADDGNLLYDQVVSANPNIVLVLAGHRHGSGINLKSVSGTDSTHKVVELLSDYQAYLVPASNVFDAQNCPTCIFGPNGSIDVDGNGTVDHAATDKLIFGSSFLRLLQFNTKNSTVSVDSYSPFLNEFGPTKYDPLNRYNGAEENFTVPIDLVSRTTSFSTDALTVVTPTGTVIGSGTAQSGWPVSVTWSGLTQGETYAWAASSRNEAGENLGTVEQYGGVFAATSAGTDLTAPVLSIATTASVEQNTHFDPLSDVSATDNADGDVTGRIQVVGSVDTATPGTYSLLYSVADTNGNTTQSPRAVQVLETPKPALTEVSLVGQNVSATFGSSAALTATVSAPTATGSVQFSNGEDTLCQATITAGAASCTVAILPPPGVYAIEAEYSGDSTHAESKGTFVLTVKDATKQGSSLTASVTKSTYGTSATVAVAVAGPAGLSGTVTISGAGATQTKPVGSGFTLPATLKPGTYALHVTYSGDAIVNATFNTATVKVDKHAGPKPKLTISKRPTSRSAGRGSVTLIRPSGLSAITGKVTVTLTSGSHTKKVSVTLSHGSASVKLPKLGFGRWKATVTYAGNGYYTSSKGSAVTAKLR